MSTLETAAQRLTAALDTLEKSVATATQSAAAGSGGGEGDADSLRQQLTDLTAEYESLLQRYDALVEKHISLSDRLDNTINRLRTADLAVVAGQ